MNNTVKIAELINIKYPIVLASQSPRRKYLLTQLGLDFEIIPANIDENLSLNLEPSVYAKTLAENKAKFVASSLKTDSIVIGSDTIVVLDGTIINKPENEQDAFNMLKALSGNTHTVYTGLSLVFSGNMKTMTNVQKTDVTFRDLDDVEIRAYINSGSPMDKAGAYGIQDDFGAVFVKKIEGCYYNIVGLPLEMLYTNLKEFVNEI